MAADVLKPKRKISKALCNISNGEDEDPASVASELLALLTRILSHEILVSTVQKMLERQKTVQAGQKLTLLFTVVLEQLLKFANTVANNATLSTASGNVLQAPLGLFSTSEFFLSVKQLLKRKDNKLHQKTLKALKTLICGEQGSNKEAQKARLDFLPCITTTIKQNSNVLL